MRLWLLLPRGGRGAELRGLGLAAALITAGICGCQGGDEDGAAVNIGTRVSAPRLERPQLVVWRDNQLVIADADRGRARPLVGDRRGHGVVAMQWEAAAWSPDGKRFAFTGQYGALDADQDIWVARADGSRRRRITSDGASFHPVWSPDGKRIYYARRPDDHPKEITQSDGLPVEPVWIWSMRPDGSDRRAVTSPVARRFDIPGSFSPSGDALAFTRGVNRELGPEGRVIDLHEVWVMRPDGSGARRLAERSRDPAFSPDGRRIAFASDRDQNSSLSYGDRVFFANELYVMDADGSGQRRLTRTHFRNELQPAWMPGGARIAYQRGIQYQNAEETTVVQSNADGSCPREVFDDPVHRVWDAAPAWRPGDARAGDGPLRC